LCILEVRCTGGFVIRRLVREIGIGKNYFFILAHSENGMSYYSDQAFDVSLCVWPEMLLFPGLWLVPHQTLTQWFPDASRCRMCSRSK